MDDLALNMLKTCDDHGCLIIHRKPGLRGRDKYFRYKAPDLSKTNFVTCCDHAWGGNRFKKCAEQRKKIREQKQISKETAKRLWWRQLRPGRRADQQRINKKQMLGQTDEWLEIDKEDDEFKFADTS